MKRICDFSRTPVERNYAIADLQALKGSDKKLSMSNPANANELRACVDTLKAFHGEVAAHNFPYAETNISMKPTEKEKFLEALDKWVPAQQ